MSTEAEKSKASHLGVDSRLLYAAFADMRLNLWMAVTLSPVGAFLLWPYFSGRVMLVWVLAIWVVNGIGALELRAFNRVQPKGTDLAFWRNLFVVQAVLAALGWALGPTLLLWQSTGSGAVLLVSVLFVVCVAAMLSVAHVKPAMQGFVIAAMLPPAISAFVAPSGVEQATGVMLLIGMCVILAVGSGSADNIQAEVEAQLRLQGILDNALDAVINVDVQGRITGWNPRAQALLGWSQSEVLGYTFDDIVELRAAAGGEKASLMQLAVANGDRPDGRAEMLVEQRNGVPLHAEIAVTRSQVGKVVSFTAFMADITQRKDSEEKLAVFRKVFESSKQCLVITDGHGFGLYQNPAHALALGYSDAEIAGRFFEEALPSETGPQTVAEIRKTVAKTGSWGGPLQFRRKDGSKFMSNSAIGSIVDGAGAIQYVFNIFTDITEELAQRAELRAAKEEAERANRAKSEFLSSMSHELRTPLNAILGFSQIMEFDDQLGPDSKKGLAEISRAGHHLLKLINEVLDLAKIQSGAVELALEPVAVGDVIDECWRLLYPLATERKLTVHKQVPKRAVVRADRARLKQVLLNLLSNAIKFNQEKGDIGIRVTQQGSDRLRVDVRDTGPGIAPERLGNVFKPFNAVGKAKGAHEGAGISLSITEQLVTLMGGTVGVKSQFGKGAEFWFELPMDPSGSVEGYSEPAPLEVQPMPDGKTHHVLCIDDNAVNLRLITQILAKRPAIEVTTAPTPGLGIQLALARQPDLILLDINMPGMDGYQVLDVLKTYGRTKNIPIVAVTANSEPREQKEGGTAGLDAYITKPLDVPLFLATVDQFLAKAKRPVAS